MSKKMTGKELVDFARGKIGTAYVYGMKGQVMTAPHFNYLYERYGGAYVPYSDLKKIGQVCVDCSGLIGWGCGKMLSSAGWKAAADEVHPIMTLPQAPLGALVWKDGHIGIYSGRKKGVPHYIAAENSRLGVREFPITENEFTHWLLVHNVFAYEEEEEEMVVQEKIQVDGREHPVSLIRKEGVTYIKSREIAGLLGYAISSEGRMPVFTKK
ncbi:MAG: hypothetical protein Q4C06_06530 [Bacillota bacterium]|nr:hypothetical protein [Bacillota bacterium]